MTEDEKREINYQKFMEEVGNTPNLVTPEGVAQHTNTGISTESPEKFDSTYRERYKELMQQLEITDPQLVEVIYTQLRNTEFLPENLEDTVKSLINAQKPQEKTADPAGITLETMDSSAADSLAKDIDENNKTAAQKSEFVPQVATPTANIPSSKKDDLTNDNQEIEK